jgi:hypothetical protein
MTKFSLLGFFLFSFMLLGACNVFDPLYSDTGSNDFEKTLANAEAAMKRDDYGTAAQLYEAALSQRSNSSVAMLGIASAILMRDVEIRDIPALMNAVFNINLTNRQNGETNSFIDNAKISDDIEIIAEAASNAAWWRSPVNGIDRASGKISLDGQDLPFVTAGESDGVIAATNANAILNYIIIKTIHIAFEVQKKFELAEDLQARISDEDWEDLTSSYDTNDIVLAVAANGGTLPPAKDAEFKADFLAKYAELTNAAAEFKLISVSIISDSVNTSPDNLVGVADAMLRLFEQPGSSMNSSTVGTVRNAINDIRIGLDGLRSSFETGGEVYEALLELDDFIEELRNFGADDVTYPGKTNWFT